MSADSEQLRVVYEGIVKHNPANAEAVHYLAVWHLERQSFQQVIIFIVNAIYSLVIINNM